MIKKVQATVMDIMFLHKFLSEEIEENQNSEPIYPAIVEMLMIKNYKLILPVVKEIDQKLSCGIIDIVYHPRLRSFVLFTQDGRIFTIK